MTRDIAYEILAARGFADERPSSPAVEAEPASPEAVPDIDPDVIPEVETEAEEDAAASRPAQRLFGGTLVMFAANIVCGLCFILLMRGKIPADELYLWFGTLLLTIVYRTLLWWEYRKPARREDARPWPLLFAAGAAVTGVVWGYALGALVGGAELSSNVLLIVLVAALSVGTVIASAGSVVATAAFLLPALAPMALNFLLSEQQYSFATTMFIAGFLGLLMKVSYDLRSMIAENDVLLDNNSKLTSTDPATGALSIDEFRTIGEAEIARAVRYERPLSLLVLNVDNQRRINDIFGRFDGDNCLRSLVTHLRSLIRDSDQIGRLGGDEFAILLTETNLERAMEAGERLRTSVANSEVGGRQGPIRFTISAGVAEHGAKNNSIDMLIRSAEDALREAKNEGKDRVASAARSEGEKVATFWNPPDNGFLGSGTAMRAEPSFSDTNVAPAPVAEPQVPPPNAVPLDDLPEPADLAPARADDESEELGGIWQPPELDPAGEDLQPAPPAAQPAPQAPQAEIPIASPAGQTTPPETVAPVKAETGPATPLPNPGEVAAMPSAPTPEPAPERAPTPAPATPAATAKPATPKQAPAKAPAQKRPTPKQAAPKAAAPTQATPKRAAQKPADPKQPVSKQPAAPKQAAPKQPVPKQPQAPAAGKQAPALTQPAAATAIAAKPPAVQQAPTNQTAPVQPAAAPAPAAPATAVQASAPAPAPTTQIPEVPEQAATPAKKPGLLSRAAQLAKEAGQRQAMRAKTGPGSPEGTDKQSK